MGWWFDGCYPPNTMCRTKEPPDFASFTDASWSKKVADIGGVVTWDVPIQKSGLIAQSFIDRLTAIGKAFARA